MRKLFRIPVRKTVPPPVWAVNRIQKGILTPSHGLFDFPNVGTIEILRQGLPLKNQNRLGKRRFSSCATVAEKHNVEFDGANAEASGGEDQTLGGMPKAEHAVISTFDMFSIGIGPSSSHTVGPMRAGRIFVTDLEELGLLDKVKTLKIGLFGSLAATGKGHMTPEAILLGLEGSDPETVEPTTINSRYDSIVETKRLTLNGRHVIKYDSDKDMIWTMDPLPTHPNGMRFMVFDDQGEMLATNEYFSVGGGFVVNERTKVDENLYYRGINKDSVSEARREQTHGVDSTAGGAAALPAPGGIEEEEQVGLVVDNQKNNALVTAEDPAPRQPEFLFRDAAGLLALTKKHNLSIAQLVWNNELAFLPPEDVDEKLMRIWSTMDGAIHAGVHSKEKHLPGRLQVRRRAPGLYKRLFKGFYPTLTSSMHEPMLGPPGQDPLAVLGLRHDPQGKAPGTGTGEGHNGSTLKLSDGIFLDRDNSQHQKRLASSLSSVAKDTNSTTGKLSQSGATATPVPKKKTKRPVVVGSFNHDIPIVPPRSTDFPGIDFLSCYAIAVNEVNASGGRIVTSPTNGASGVIPSVIKYVVEFLSEDWERDVKVFLLTASAIGMLYKRGATISAAEGGCMAEVGVASSMAAGGFAACMGGTPAQILQAAEIGIEHSLGLTCDPIDGLVQVPCIERNSLGAVKAVTAAQLALAGDGIHSVSLDEAIEAMRVTARDMSHHYKETSLSGLATTVKIPLSNPAC